MQSALDDIFARFEDRHRDLEGTFRAPRQRAGRPAESRPRAVRVDARCCSGATFTSEYAIEGAALCNPSIVAHPDQTGIDRGQRAFRDERPRHRRGPPLVDRIPNRHRDADGSVAMDDPGPVRDDRVDRAGRYSTQRCSAASSHGSDDAGEAADYVLDALGEHFTPSRSRSTDSSRLAHQQAHPRPRRGDRSR